MRCSLHSPSGKWCVRHFSSEKRKPRAGRGKPGGDVLTSSLFRKFTGKSIPKSFSLNSQSARAKPISPSSRKSPPAICSSPATPRLSSGSPATQPRGQQYQLSYMRNTSPKPPSMVNHASLQDCGFPSAILVCPLCSGDFQQPGDHMDFTPTSCFSKTTR